MKTFWIVTLLLFSMSAYSQEKQEKVECEEIVEAIKKGEVSELSPYFAGTVECDIFGKSNVYSKAQTTQVMKDFFSQNKPKQFKVIHQGGQGKIKFFIGTYQTIAGKKFRISIFFKQEPGKKEMIQQIRIENDNDSK